MAEHDEEDPDDLRDPTRGGLKYYIFDWDDNVLQMPTKIVLERRQEGNDGELWEPCEVSTSTFALIRNDTANYRPPNGDWESAFVNFRDLDESRESSFLSDTREALAPVIAGEAKPAPSFHVFRQTLVAGRLFAIVTARGHMAESIRKGVAYFIDEVLTEVERAEMIENLRGYFFAFGKEEEDARADDEVIEYYLSLNRYHGVTSPEFQKEIVGETDGTGSQSPEEAKQLAIRDFVHHVIGLVSDGDREHPVSIGFSDDDLGNVEAAREYIEGVLAKEFPYVTFVVFDTSDPELPSGRKTILQGQLELDFGE